MSISQELGWKCLDLVQPVALTTLAILDIQFQPDWPADTTPLVPPKDCHAMPVA